ncbi:uncharacterized protein LOC143024030 [Oratosquilla oratoria]|uniref:uncharacterized protein LOC143024030 n=1 Tax=Oratosquilla oratoria TaxID=337810 RepID=UPI003F76D609
MALANACFDRCQKFIEAATIDRHTKRPRARVKQLALGDRVYVTAKPRQEVSKKLQPLYQGPYRVIRRVSDVIYAIKHIKSGREFCVHTDRIKLEGNLSVCENKNVRRAFPTHEQEVTDLLQSSESDPSE